MRYVVLPLDHESLVQPGDEVSIQGEAHVHFQPRFLRVSGTTAQHFKVTGLTCWRTTLFAGSGAVPADVFAEFERDRLAELLASLEVERHVLDLELDLPALPAGASVVLGLRNVSLGCAYPCGAALFGEHVTDPWRPKPVSVAKLAEKATALGAFQQASAEGPVAISSLKVCAACRLPYANDTLCVKGGLCHGA